MPESIYTLGVRLVLDGSALTAGANLAMRTFGGVESSARSMERAVNSTRFTLRTEGVTAAADQLMQSYRQLDAAGKGVGGISASTLAAGLQGHANAYIEANKQLTLYDNQIKAAQRSVESLSASLDKMQVVNQRGVPGTLNPLTGTPFSDSPGNRLYEYTQNQRDAAVAQVAAAKAGLVGATPAATSAYGILQTQVMDQANAMEEAQRIQAKAMNRAMGLTMGGALAGAVGGGMFGFLKGATQQAMDYQTVMLGVQTATQASAAEMANFDTRAQTIGAHNQMSMTDVARVMQAATQAGITDPKLLDRMVGPLANFGEVLKMSHGMDPARSATVATTFAHLFGAYGKQDPNDITNMVNLLGKALFVTPASPAQLQTLVSQFAGVMRPVYGNANNPLTPHALSNFTNDAIEAAMVESYLGQHGRGGTGLASMITRTIGNPTFRSQAQRGALRRIQNEAGPGESFFDANGVFRGFDNMVNVLALAEKRIQNPQAIGRLFTTAFGQVGERQAGILGDPATQQAIALAHHALSGVPDLSDIQKSYNQTPQGQINQAQANWNTLMVLIGSQLLPTIAAWATSISNLLDKINLWVSQNKAVVGFIATFMGVTAVLLAIVGPIVAFAGAIQLVMLAFTGATIGFLALAGPLALIVISIAALTLLLMNWDTVMKALAKNPLLDFFFGNPLRGATSPFKDVGDIAEGIKTGNWGEVLFGKQAQPAAPFGNNPKHKQPHWVNTPYPHWATGGGGAYPQSRTLTSPRHSTTQTVHVNVGGVHVHAQPHHDAHQIAHEVEKVLSHKIGQASRYAGLLPAGLSPGTMGF